MEEDAGNLAAVKDASAATAAVSVTLSVFSSSLRPPLPPASTAETSQILPDAVGSPRILLDADISSQTSPDGMETAGEGERSGGAGERSNDDGEDPLTMAPAAIAMGIDGAGDSILPVSTAVAGWPLLSAPLLIGLVGVHSTKIL
jgi:hypothetical protein